MKRLLPFIILLFLLPTPAHAAHIKGGFFSYQFLGPGLSEATNVRYKVTLTVFMVCTSSSAQISNPINFTIFNGNGQFVRDESVVILNQYDLGKVYDEPCISGDQRGCYYKVIVYELPSVELPRTAAGYIFSYQRCCRIGGIQNISPPSSAIGNTFTITIPGTATAPGAETNNSPVFPVNDTAVVCGGGFFQYSFKATDADGDLLSYQFCNALAGPDQNDAAPSTAAAPPYPSVPYDGSFSGSSPMGPGVTIDPVTGVISGIAPALTGEYVVCVCVSETRNGVLLGVTRKELHIQVKDCEPLDARLDPKPTTCDGFTVNFANDGVTPAGTDYLWTFGEPSSGGFNSSTLPASFHTYAAAGTYTVTLKVSLAGLCVDSATTQVNVFPGFFPGFTVAGNCSTNPFLFTDTTRTNYGVVNSWSWNFGDETTVADTSHLQNPQWHFTTPGTKNVTLIVTNSKGCINTVSFPLDVLDKPILTKAFADTLICVPDMVQLGATGSGVFSWTPLTNIINANTASPTVNPTTSTWYVVTLNNSGCINKDSVNVRVTDHVTLSVRADTTSCQGDPVQLKIVTNGTQYQWSPAGTLNDPAISNPIASPLTTTTYQVMSRLGSCLAIDSLTVFTVPYPIVKAVADTTICYNSAAQLAATFSGTSFNWTPVNYLNDPHIANPFATPPRTTSFIISVYDTLGCPKPGRDTVVVTVNPKIKAFAGRDTTVVVGQPLQLNGSGGVSYLWSPSTGLSNTTIVNPVGIYGAQTDSVRYKLLVKDLAGCADSAFITVRIFKTSPFVFVPTAFTPNGDGRNDIIRPIPVGIQRINYFSIYNRWGQLIFTTSEIGRGWDGRIKGVLQGTNIFVWMVSAVDYLGKPVFLKGTVALLR